VVFFFFSKVEHMLRSISHVTTFFENLLKVFLSKNGKQKSEGNPM